MLPGMMESIRRWSCIVIDAHPSSRPAGFQVRSSQAQSHSTGWDVSPKARGRHLDSDAP